MSFLDGWLFNAKEAPRRLRVYELSFDALAGLLQLDGTFILKMDGYPEGARLSFVEADNERGVVRLYVEHESFEELRPGVAILTGSAIEATRFNLPVVAKVEVTA